jgi:hypothetical protein
MSAHVAHVLLAAWSMSALVSAAACSAGLIACYALGMIKP